MNTDNLEKQYTIFSNSYIENIKLGPKAKKREKIKITKKNIDNMFLMQFFICKF